jgi:nicotinamide mononucleotide adenylyltransferase
VNHTILTEAGWKLRRYISEVPDSKYNYYYLEHDCPLMENEPFRKNLIQNRFYYMEFKHPCLFCDHHAPGELQAMYVFLSGEMLA